jgi:cyclo(L-tyrosyl-L-tyrosyl) synthase
MIEKILTINPVSASFGHCMLGVSPFNGYFKDYVLYELFKWANSNFDSFHVFFPDIPTTYTFRAFGYSEQKAIEKMHKQSRWMRNKIIRMLVAVNIQNPEKCIIDGRYLTNNNVFNRLYSLQSSLYKNSANFKEICVSTTTSCYEKSLYNYGGKQHLQFDPEISANYIVWELPVICKTTEILNIPNSVFCYHQSMQMVENIFTKESEFSFITDDSNAYGLLKEIS